MVFHKISVVKPISKMEDFIRGSLLGEMLQVEVFTFIQMVLFIKVNLEIQNSTVVEYLSTLIED